MPTSLLLLTSFLLLAPPDGDVCPDCTPRRLCKPHAALVAAGLVEVERDLEDADPAVRAQALVRAAGLNAGHTNAPAKEVTKVLAGALEDAELTVRTTAAELLGSGQDPDTAVRALVASTAEIPRLLASERDAPEGRPVMDFALAVVGSVAAYRDDRSVEALGDLLVRNPESLYGDVVYRIVDGLTDLASRSGVEALLAYELLMEGLGFFPALEKHIHERLVALAEAQGLEGAPAWSEEGVARAWKRWFDENARRLPKKLGKASLPPAGR